MRKILSVFLFMVPLFLGASEHIASDFEELMGKNCERWKYVNSPEEREILSFYESAYEKTKDLQYSPSEHYKIPKRIHLIWLGPKSFPLASINTMRSWMVHHPDWDFHFWTDRERIIPIHGFQTRYVDQFVFRKLKKYYDESVNWSEKADILRLEFLAQEGGIYIDHDAFCLRPYDALNQAYDFYACLEAPHEPIAHHNITVGMGLIGTRPEHPIILEAVNNVAANWDRFTRQFSVTDPLSQLEKVMHRTYMPLSFSVMNSLGRTPYKDIVFPAAYFYPIENMTGIYSKHLYASSWNFYGDSSKTQFVHFKINKPLKKMKEVVFMYAILTLSSILALAGIIGWKIRRRTLSI
jgi:hypothetical protein